MLQDGGRRGMRTEVAALFEHDGPFVRVYLDARSDQPQAQQQVATRWKTARSALSAEGATDDDLTAIDATVESLTTSAATRWRRSPSRSGRASSASGATARRAPAARGAVRRGDAAAARLVDACIRAAYGTSADVRIVPSAVVTDGLGAILRHTGTTPDRP